MDQDLNKKAKTISSLDENKEENLCSLGLGKEFLAINNRKTAHKRGGKNSINKLLFK